jgi:hypothetical protein
MATVREVLHVPGELESVFALVADFGRASEWDPLVLRSARLDEGPLRVGSEFGLVIRSPLGPRYLRYGVESIDRPHRVVLVGGNRLFATRDTIALSRSGEGVRIDYEARLGLWGLAPLGEPVLGLVFRRLARDAVGGLQRRLEQLAAGR